MKDIDTDKVLNVRSRRRPRHHLGFTLLELLITSVIVALLMGGVLTLVAHLGSDRSRLGKDGEDDSAGHLIELLRKDLTRAVAVQDNQNGNGLTIQGYGAIDSVSLRPSDRPAQIIYRVVEVGREQWLIRAQTALNESKNSAWVQCVGFGVRVISLTPDLPSAWGMTTNAASDQLAVANSKFSADPTKIAESKPSRLPNRLRLRIEWSDPNRKTLDEELVLR